METKAKNSSTELEATRMAAVLNASYPKGWRFRAAYYKSGSRFRAFANIERFDGVYWNVAKLISGDWASEKDEAFASMLANWAGKSSWMETIRNMTLPWPPASSTEELCLKLSLLEDAK